MYAGSETLKHKQNKGGKMKTIIASFVLAAFLIVPQMAFADECSQVLQQAGLGPHCGGTTCEDFRESPVAHQFCAGQSGTSYAPIQAIQCTNSTTGESKSFPASQLIPECMKLASQDPAWAPQQCYCCCS